jgi:hypothetical protein
MMKLIIMIIEKELILLSTDFLRVKFIGFNLRDSYRRHDVIINNMSCSLGRVFMTKYPSVTLHFGSVHQTDTHGYFHTAFLFFTLSFILYMLCIPSSLSLGRGLKSFPGDWLTWPRDILGSSVYTPADVGIVSRIWS